jgi:hypothetical protein
MLTDSDRASLATLALYLNLSDMYVLQMRWMRTLGGLVDAAASVIGVGLVEPMV